MRKFALFAMVLGLVGCRDSSSGDDTATPDGANADDVKIQDVQSPSMPACAAATPEGCVELKLKGVVVTAIDNFGAIKGDIWVQEPEGGPYSGVQVYNAPLDQVSQLQVGDIVDIAGAQKTEYVFTDTKSGNMSLGLTELEAIQGGTLTITKTGANMPVEPAVIDALAIGQMSDFMARHAEWEKWQGVLVKVNNAQAYGATACITSQGMCKDPTYENFDITGDVKVQSSLAAMPTPKPVSGDCFSSVTGVVGDFFDYYILPRTTAEMGTGGTSCPTENQAATCTDNIDNDGNGFKDCADNNCIAVEATCRTTTTISAIQTATTPPTGGVELQNVLVAGVSYNKKNLWVQTDAQAATNQGIYIQGPGADLSGFAVGSRVNVVGKVDEGNNATGTETLTRVNAYTVTAGTGTATPLPVANQSAATLNVSATGEPLESVLVELKNVRITAAGVAQDYIATMRQNGTDFKADDDIYRVVAADVTKCYSSIVGFWSYNFFVDQWVFLPRKGAGSAPEGTLAMNQADCI